MTPVFMAFPELQTTEITYLDNIMNIVFGVDILLNFFLAYYDEDFVIVDDNKVTILFTNLIRKSPKTILDRGLLGILSQ